MIDGEVELLVERPPADDTMLTPRTPDAGDLAVGRLVASVIPPGSTVQVGPGGIAEAVMASTSSPVRVWSGLATDAMAGLHERGLLDGPVRAAYVWGGAPVEALHAAGRLELLPLERSHDLTMLSSLRNYVACNTALQIGLDGSCNVEAIGGRAIAGIGGNADFAAAAARSSGGLSIMALKSTTRSGRSTIVPRVERVSTPRCDVDLVITEHGIADLRDADDAERARRIVAVADPSHREELISHLTDPERT
jgi:acyl-CoA hydrolase